MGAIMLFSLFLLLFSLRPAAAQKSVDIANIQMPAYLGTMTSAANPCTSAKQFVSAIRLHPRGGKVQIYTVQVLDSANNWQTLNVAGVLPANKDTDWLPLTVGLNRCISQILVYGDGILQNPNDSPVHLLISAQLDQIK